MSASASWTRLAFLAHGQNRAAADNRATLGGMRAPAYTFHRSREDVAGARARASAVMDGLVQAMVGPGVALVAVDKQGEVAGTLTLMAKPGAINAGVIGRHGRCDLYLAGDDMLSLRHATVVVDEHGGFRLLDLRTGSGLRDVAGRRHEGIASTEETVVALGDHVVIARARRGADVDGPMRSPWMPPLAIGTRVEAEAPEFRPHGTGFIADRREPAPNLAMTFTGSVTRTGHALLGGDEQRRGLLELADGGSREVWPVGDRSLANGILLGRYERCDGHGSRILSRRGISRVHALVVTADAVPYVIDLGSTNGTWIDDDAVRVARLSIGSCFRLGERGPSITWRAAG
jgi:hypothetical protein